MEGETQEGGAQPAGNTPPQTSVEEAQVELGKLAIMDDESAVTPGGSQPQDKAPAGNESETKSDLNEEPDNNAEPEPDDEQEPEVEKEDGADASRHESPRVEKRIAKLTAQREEMRERYEESKARIEELEAQVVQPIGLHPDYLTPDERTLIANATALDEKRAFLIRHIGRGYDDPRDANKSMSAEQIAEELVAVERNAGRIAKAQALYDDRKQQMIEDMLAGRQLRLAKNKLTKPTVPKPPVAPAVKPGATSQPVSQQVQRKGVDLDRFDRNGADKDAAARELAELVP